MTIKFIAEITADIKVFPDDPINSDTIGDYKAELDCNIGNSALNAIKVISEGFSDIKILSCEPCDEGIDEYSQLLNNWQSDYNSKMNIFKEKYERKGIQKNMGT